MKSPSTSMSFVGRAPAPVLAATIVGMAIVLALLFAPPATAQSWTDLGPDILGTYGITAAEVGDISDGYSDGTWRPYNDMTRAQFVKMAVERFDLPIIEPASPTFQDIPPSHPFYAYIETAYRAQMIVGVGDGYFAPNRTVDRAQGAAIIVRYLADLRGTTTEELYSQAEIENILAPFEESLTTIGPALADELAAAVAWDILQGTAQNQLNPRRQLARIQGAAMLIRASAPEAEEVDVTIYFLEEGQLRAANRTVTVGPALAVGSAALEQLLAGPTQGEADAGLATAIPPTTNLIGLDIDDDGLATVNLDADFTAAAGDEAAQRASLAQIVYTLTEFDTVDRVHFHIAGEVLEQFGGIDLEPSVARPAGPGDPFWGFAP